MIQGTDSFIFHPESSQGLHQVTDCPDLNFTLPPPLLTSPSAPPHLTPTFPHPHHLLLLTPQSALAHLNLLWKTKVYFFQNGGRTFPLSLTSLTSLISSHSDVVQTSILLWKSKSFFLLCSSHALSSGVLIWYGSVSTFKHFILDPH